MRKRLQPLLQTLQNHHEARTMSVELPTITENPLNHHDCCATISSKLLRNLAKHLPRENGLVLSIGCGSGLLEALLQRRQPHLIIEGVEVARGVNKYLPHGNVHMVGGTWDTSSRAEDAAAWLFVYPRKPALLAYYLEAYENACVKTVIWIGPRADWEDFCHAFSKSQFRNFLEMHDSGLASYEVMMVVVKDVGGPLPVVRAAITLQIQSDSVEILRS